MKIYLKAINAFTANVVRIIFMYPFLRKTGSVEF